MWRGKNYWSLQLFFHFLLAQPYRYNQMKHSQKNYQPSTLMIFLSTCESWIYLFMDSLDYTERWMLSVQFFSICKFMFNAKCKLIYVQNNGWTEDLISPTVFMYKFIKVTPFPPPHWYYLLHTKGALFCIFPIFIDLVLHHLLNVCELNKKDRNDVKSIFFFFSSFCLVQ